MSFLKVLSDGNWLNKRRVRDYPRIFLILFVLFGIAWMSGLHGKLRPDEGVVVTDFINVYSAGVAVHNGNPADAYDWKNQKIRQDGIEKSLEEKERAQPDTDFLPWLYPPMFLSVAWLLSFLPYWTALAAYSLLGLAAYAFTMRKLVPPRQEAYVALAAFPGVFINLFSGQNGAITTALMAAGLFLLDTAPVSAGVAFGALSYKPHFFVLIPLVLLVGRHWKALASTCASALIYAGLSLLAFGAESWQAFFENAGKTASLLGETSDRWLGILHSVFSAVRVFGGSVPFASALQILVALCAVAVLVKIWHGKSASLAVRAASLAAAALLISPYSFVYDQVLLAIPIALLAKEGFEKGFLPYEKTFLFALWLLPFLVQDSGAHFALPLTPPMLIGLMVVCWRRAREESTKPKYLRTLRSWLFNVTHR